MHRRLLALAACAAAASTMSCAVIGGLAGSDRDPHAPGDVTGYVYEDETGEGIAGATVSILGTDRTVTTRSDGSFDMIGIAPATYQLQAAVEGFSISPIERVRVRAGRVVWVKFFLIRPGTEES